MFTSFNPQEIGSFKAFAWLSITVSIMMNSPSLASTLSTCFQTVTSLHCTAFERLNWYFQKCNMNYLTNKKRGMLINTLYMRLLTRYWSRLYATLMKLKLERICSLIDQMTGSNVTNFVKIIREDFHVNVLSPSEQVCSLSTDNWWIMKNDNGLDLPLLQTFVGTEWWVKMPNISKTIFREWL